MGEAFHPSERSDPGVAICDYCQLTVRMKPLFHSFGVEALKRRHIPCDLVADSAAAIITAGKKELVAASDVEQNPQEIAS